MSNHTYSFGATVRGPLHCQERRANEDAWLHVAGSFGVLAAVCDGMGSKPHAREGARAACAAVKEAVSRWAKAEGAPLAYLPHLIEVFWRLRLHPMEPQTAATTCLLALATQRGTWIVGGLGDGLAITRSGADLQIVIGDRGGAFVNETAALGVSRGPRDWTLLEFPPSDRERIAVLATDGIADDLRPDRLAEFCDWLAETFCDLTPTARVRTLAAELRAWPTPGHLDDKTLAVLHRPGPSVEGTK